MDERHVDAMLHLLTGMQARCVIARSIELTDNGVKLEGLEKWEPVVEHPELGSPVLDGLGEGPDD